MVFKGKVGVVGERGWRLKGCGGLKRGLKNYQQGRAGTLPVVEEREKEKETEKKGKGGGRQDAV